MRYIGTDPLPLVVSVADFAAAVHGIVTEAEELALTALLAAAQDVVATATNTPLAPGLYEFTYPLGGWRRWWIPCRPVTAITGLAVTDDSGEFVDRDATGVMLLQGHDEPQLLLPDGWLASDDAGRVLRVQVEAGAAPSPAIPRAIIMMAQEWRLSDITVTSGEAAPRASFGTLRLMRQARYLRPQITAGC